MSWRIVVVEKRAKLEMKMGFLVVRAEETKRVALSDIAVLIVENTASAITTALIEELVEKKVAVLFCDSKRNPHSLLCALHGAYNSSERVIAQTKWDEEIKDTVWALIVKEKIRQQARLLGKYKPNDKDKVLKYIDEIEPGDRTNREGQAARVYLNHLLWPDFSRRDSEWEINAYFNYGYSIILSYINRCIACQGYITELGVHHIGPENKFNLGCDLVEPFRPLIDSIAITMPMVKEMTRTEKDPLINSLNKEAIIGGKRTTVMLAMNTYVKSVFAAIENKDPSLIKFCDYEL